MLTQGVGGSTRASADRVELGPRISLGCTHTADGLQYATGWGGTSLATALVALLSYSRFDRGRADDVAIYQPSSGQVYYEDYCSHAQTPTRPFLPSVDYSVSVSPLVLDWSSRTHSEFKWQFNPLTHKDAYHCAGPYCAGNGRYRSTRTYCGDADPSRDCIGWLRTANTGFCTPRRRTLARARLLMTGARVARVGKTT